MRLNKIVVAYFLNGECYCRMKVDRIQGALISVRQGVI
jgi:hypothetical protein